MSGAAEIVMRAMTRHRSTPRPDPITDPFAQAVARRLEHRGIARVPGLYDEPEWFDVALDTLRRQQAQREAESQPESQPADSRNPPAAARALFAAIAAQADPTGGSSHVPLNGAAVLRAALAGQPGTVNGSQ